MDICAIEECQRHHYGRGFCKSHYNSFRKKGLLTRELQIGIKANTKWCPRCRAYLSFDHFNKNKRGVKGLMAYCRVCSHRKAVARYHKLQDFQYDQLLDNQKGLCAICKRVPSGNGSDTRLHIDHDHLTKKVRGLLCGSCNRGLGLFKDSPALLNEAKIYLSNN